MEPVESDAEPRRLKFFRRATDPPRRRFRRGVYLLPSLLTLGNMFCGYACIVYSMRGEFETAALFIGYAIVLDMLDGRIARLTGATSDFGLQFDSLADVISFGLAPAILSFSWGLSSLGRLGWAAGFLFVTGAAMRLARFNIQAPGGGDKRDFVGMPSPGASALPSAAAHCRGVHAHHVAASLRARRDGIQLSRLSRRRHGRQPLQTPRRPRARGATE